MGKILEWLKDIGFIPPNDEETSFWPVITTIILVYAIIVWGD